MDYVGKIGSCTFNDTANASDGYLLNVPAYTQTNTDTTINEFSANSVTPSITSPSNLAAATLWGVPHNLHFINTSKGAWCATSDVLRNYDNSKGHSLLIFFRFKCATPPTGADTFFLGNALGGSDSIGLRVRQTGTAFPVGGDGQLVFAAYNNGSGSAQGFQSNSSICDNTEHSVAVVINRTTNKGDIYIDGNLSSSTGINSLIQQNTFSVSPTFGIGCVGGNNTLSNSLACDIRDLKIVYTPSTCKSQSEITTLIKKLHFQPYSTITKSDWGY